MTSQSPRRNGGEKTPKTDILLVTYNLNSLLIELKNANCLHPRSEVQEIVLAAVRLVPNAFLSRA